MSLWRSAYKGEMAIVTNVKKVGCYKLRRAQGYSLFSLCPHMKCLIILKKHNTIRSSAGINCGRLLYQAER